MNRTIMSRCRISPIAPEITDEFIKGYNYCFTLDLEEWVHEVPHTLKEGLCLYTFGGVEELISEVFRLIIEIIEYIKGGVSYEHALQFVDGNFVNYLDGIIQNLEQTNEIYGDPEASYVDSFLSDNILDIARAMGVLVIEVYPQVVNELQNINIGTGNYFECVRIDYLAESGSVDLLSNNIRVYLSISPYGD